MPKPNPQPVTARLTTPAQMVASLPLWLGYVPTESLVVACCHEPRGRIGLTLRFDLPDPAFEQELVEEVVRRVAHQEPTRVLVVVYTDEPDEPGDALRARAPMVDELCAQLVDALPHLRVTEAVLVRRGRFWSYLCDDVRCCPEEGTPVEAGQQEGPVVLLEAEQVLRGQVVQPDRVALERSLAGPAAEVADRARERCQAAATQHVRDASASRAAWRARWYERWAEAVREFASPPAALDDEEAAVLATSLQDAELRDVLAGSHEAEHLLPVLADLCRRTPVPYDAPVCTLYAWLTYCEGGGAEVTITLDRALRTDPSYRLAQLLAEVMLSQVPPSTVRELTREAAGPRRAARRRGRR